MLTFELMAIAGILIFQPLIALLWVYAAYRAAVSYTFGRAESAVDGRIEQINETIRSEN